MLTAQLALGQSSTPLPLTSQPTDETVASNLKRLASLPPSELKRADLALKTALEFALAVGQADGPRAAALIDAIGYQALPLTGSLPTIAQKPVAARDAAAVIARLPPFDISELPTRYFEPLAPEELARQFPAVGEWILPTQDIVIRVAPVGGAPDGWVARPACIIVRIRGPRATIMGGNLLEALTAR